MKRKPGVLLVDVAGWQGGATGNQPFPNIGIAYLVPALEKAGFDTVVADMNNESIPEKSLISLVATHKPDIIGFSIKTATVHNARLTGRLLKKHFPDSVIVAGGPHATVAGTDLIKEEWVDFVIPGEGEEVLPTFSRMLLDGGDGNVTSSVISKTSIVNEMDIPRVADLDSLAFPDYNRFSQGARTHVSQIYPLVTSRGCVYQCIYCSVPKISGRGIRKRSIENIMQELKHVSALYHIAGFEIIDDAFNADMNRAKQFCIALMQEQLSLEWSCPNGLRADRVDAELAGLMYQSGCRSVMVGVESADPAVLLEIRKGETLEEIERGIRIFQAAGISVGGYFIIGLPSDSYASQERSVEFAKRMGITAHFNMLIPYPGTDLWVWAGQHARFRKSVENGMHFADSSRKVDPVIDTEAFPAEERIRAYEMVHTRLGRLDLVIQHGTTGWLRFLKVVLLIWRYDRVRIWRSIKNRMSLR